MTTVTGNKLKRTLKSMFGVRSIYKTHSTIFEILMQISKILLHVTRHLELYVC